VVDFSFKSPCVIYYTRIDINNRVPKLDLINPITADVFFWNATVNKKNVVNNRVIKIGETHQLPKEGDIIAVDAEFVSLASEETEIVSEANSNYYSRIVVNPTHYSLARVSVLLDQFPGSASPKEMSRFSPISGIPLVDDYIVTNEPIADYLTRYSGISPGDLDPNVSTHHLTTLKVFSILFFVNIVVCLPEATLSCRYRLHSHRSWFGKRFSNS
jgi:PAB-dependent poly(A)-specific ribonuclease subunit 2